MRRFQELKNAGGYKTKTGVRICITNDNSSRVDEIISFWEKEVDEVSTDKERYFPSPEEIRRKKYISSGNVFACKYVNNDIAIKCNGDVIMCCVDWFGDYVIDNITHEELTEDYLLDLYNSKKFRTIRDSITTGCLFPVICKHCIYGGEK